MRDLSVIIPARNEIFLAKTIERVLATIEADTEVIAICDGYWPDPPIVDHPRVNVLHYTESIGQRAATNAGARLSTAKYVMKLDAHCDLDQGFDRKLIEDCQPDWTMVPMMFNLHGFDWQCKNCGHRTYQGPKLIHCEQCKQDSEHEMVVVWKPRRARLTVSWRFDSDMHFQYWREHGRRPECKGKIIDTMSFIGACWFMERDRYWYLEGLDEGHGSWGQVGTEVACKSWLSGGRLCTTKKTWFSHMFRTKNDGFSFPYPMSGNQIKRAQDYSKDLWLNNKWPRAVRPLSWLVDKFKPVPGWENGEDHSRDGRVLQDAVS